MKNRRRFKSVDRLCRRWQQRYLREGHGAQLTARPVPALIHARHSLGEGNLLRRAPCGFARRARYRLTMLLRGLFISRLDRRFPSASSPSSAGAAWPVR